MASSDATPVHHRESLHETILRYGVARPHEIDHAPADEDISDDDAFTHIDTELVGARNAGDEKLPAGPVTTLMLKNVPCSVTAASMEIELRELGFEGTYDVLHFPSRRKRPSGNKGYGFVNFISAHDASRFASVFDGYAFSFAPSKRCSVTVAAFQGREASLRGIHDSATPWTPGCKELAS
eukprot:TRINITY_DN76082_c0_g1_i1.p1 TRINITY_DN76082_c0_g1~~TRINITY_DN76082_c0_g1_i1.p1  ORF type:complete len:181 (-),score=20.80 TRINITY_DN76082_c0_g1_i1:486-1028(-)